ncbi:MAG TPA: ATP-binding protein, partial [Gammaproteobacteria bacterium]|nr:ATP-binding protein [Gammaproteobacteria bacterium]
GRQVQPEPDNSPSIGILPRLSLLDSNHLLVIGQASRDPETRFYPVVSNGDTIGWLAVAPLRRPVDRADLHFQEQQYKAGLITAMLALLLAAAVSMLLAWRLLVPVRQLAAATHTLAAGDYGTRVAVTSRDELGRLAGDFNRLAGTLERNEQLRRVFMADISHELRTPLAVLRGELEALQDGVRKLTPESLQSLQGEVTALSKLVEDLYELALADVGALAYQKSVVDLVEVAASTATGFEARAAERQLNLQHLFPDKPLHLLGDRLRLMQLFNNLLENSLRYTDPGGTLRLELRRQGRQALVSLEDSAPGLPEALLPRLFERFYRPEASRSRAYGGAGLGLALCRSIVEAHGGEIEAQPSSLGGLRILIRLPLAEA